MNVKGTRERKKKYKNDNHYSKKFLFSLTSNERKKKVNTKAKKNASVLIYSRKKNADENQKKRDSFFLFSLNEKEEMDGI